MSLCPNSDINDLIRLLQTFVSSSWTPTRPTRSSTSPRTAERSSAPGTCSRTQTTRRGSTASLRCCAARPCQEAASTGRSSGAGSSPLAWPTRASAGRAKALCVCWATTTSPGASFAPTRATQPGTTAWTRPLTLHTPPG